MKLDSQINPSKEQFKALFSLPQDEPVVMLNLLKYNGEEGQAAYKRYSENIVPFLKKAEGRLIWKGNAIHTVIGDEGDQPDTVLLVEYPTVSHFINMLKDPAYQEVAKDRTIGLTYGGLIACGKQYAAW